MGLYKMCNMTKLLAVGFLVQSIKRFGEYKLMADMAIKQLSEPQVFELPAEGSNSIAIIMHHMAGNMLSRWTNFLTEDGEKPWRDRDGEFDPVRMNLSALMAYWEKGWSCLLDTLNALTPEDLEKEIKIRGESIAAFDAIIRQLMHYSSHVGQIVFIAKMFKATDWQPLTIPKNQSKDYNESMGYK